MAAHANIYARTRIEDVQIVERASLADAAENEKIPVLQDRARMAVPIGALHVARDMGATRLRIECHQWLSSQVRTLEREASLLWRSPSRPQILHYRPVLNP